jgi:hypothetical protein
MKRQRKDQCGLWREAKGRKEKEREEKATDVEEAVS